MSCPFAVLIHVLLSETWCNNPSAATVPYLMQLTHAPVSNSEENTESFTLILNIVPFILPVWINRTSLLLLSAPLLQLSGPYPFASQNDESPDFLVFSSLVRISAALVILFLVMPKASTKSPSLISLTSVCATSCFFSSSLLSFTARSNCLKNNH